MIRTSLILYTYHAYVRTYILRIHVWHIFGILHLRTRCIKISEMPPKLSSYSFSVRYACSLPKLRTLSLCNLKRCIRGGQPTPTMRKNRHNSFKLNAYFWTLVKYGLNGWKVLAYLTGSTWIDLNGEKVDTEYCGIKLIYWFEFGGSVIFFIEGVFIDRSYISIFWGGCL